MHRNGGHSPRQLPLGQTLSDKSVCENLDLSHCKIEVVDEAAKQRLRVKEECHKRYVEEELSLRKTSQINSPRPTLEALRSK